MSAVRRLVSQLGRVPHNVRGLAFLCLFVVAIGMIRPRLTESQAGWLLVGFGIATVAGGVAFLVATRRASAHLPLVAGSRRAVDAVFVVVRRTGLPLLALAFFLLWTFVYVGLWWYRPAESFEGIGDIEDPLFADFFYYAVMVALTSPPEGIVPLSRGARSATMIEILTGLALITTYVSSLVQLRRRRASAGVEDPEPDT
ncbi:MAG: hypothetical protein U0R69_10160 [Gaiellales bacterium]